MRLRGWVLGAMVIGAVGLAIFSRARAQTRRALPREPASLVRLRQEWFYGQREYPLGYIPSGARLNALHQLREILRGIKARKDQLAEAAGRGIAPQSASLANAIALSQMNWTMIGPQPTLSSGNLFSGRVTALAFDPQDNTNQTYYLGGAEGGLWRTTNAGQNWTSPTDFEPSLAVGSIALDASTNPTTIYIGTGEEDFSYDSYYGAGVLKSTDGGKTWTQDQTFTQSTGKGPRASGPYIGALAIDPFSDQILLAGVANSPGSTPGGGIWRSTDGGHTWKIVLSQSLQGLGAGTAVVYDPTMPGVAYAALGLISSGSLPAGTQGNGIFKSTDGGATWTQLAIPGVAEGSYGRIALAMGPAASAGKPGELLAAIADDTSCGAGGGCSNNLLGLWLTQDGGASWKQLTNAPDFCGSRPLDVTKGQCWYDMAVAIDPQNPSVLLAGGTQDFGAEALILSSDGGNTWSPDLWAGNFSNGGSPQPTGLLHTDTHAITISPSGVVALIGNDGGSGRPTISASGRTSTGTT